MRLTAAARQRPGSEHSGVALALAALTACPSTPTPYAPWVWITVVVIIVWTQRPWQPKTSGNA